MEKLLFGSKKNFYKANLHCHTNISDGKFSPEEIKEIYKKNGYSIVAFTDHELLITHNDLSDKDFLAINGYEVSINKDKSSYYKIKTYHLNLLSKDKNKVITPIFNFDSLWLEHSRKMISDEQKKISFKTTYSVESINHLIEVANKEGFLVTYNHPVWSLQSYPDYGDLKGLWGVEIWNTGCVLAATVDTVTPFADLVNLGNNVVPLATDDNHNDLDMCQGYTIINADSLDYDSIIDALIKGDIYASTGAVIETISFDNGKVFVKAANSRYIDITTDGRYGCSSRRGQIVNEFSFDLSNYIKECPDGCFRVVVENERGQKAYSKPYFFKDIVEG